MENDVKTKSRGDALDTAFGDDMKASVSHFLEHTSVNAKGVRDIPRKVYAEALSERGVTEEEVKRVSTAVAYVNTAASYTALHDLEEKISTASKDDLKSDEFRRKLSSTVRVPTHTGATDITVGTESVNPIPFRGEGEEPAFKTTYGRTKVSLNMKGQIHKDFHEEAAARIRKALGVKD